MHQLRSNNVASFIFSICLLILLCINCHAAVAGINDVGKGADLYESHPQHPKSLPLLAHQGLEDPRNPENLTEPDLKKETNEAESEPNFTDRAAYLRSRNEEVEGTPGKSAPAERGSTNERGVKMSPSGANEVDRVSLKSAKKAYEGPGDLATTAGEDIAATHIAPVAGFMRENEDAEENHEVSRPKRSYEDSYMQSIGYDPTMAWAKKRFDDSYLQSIGYDPAIYYGMGNKRLDDMNYLESVGYDPSMGYVKRNDDSLMHGGDYDSISPWGTKRLDDYSYMENIGYDPLSSWKKRSSYSTPHRTAGSKPLYKSHASKRSAGSMFFVDPNDYKRSPSGMGPRGFHEEIFNNNFGSFSPVKRSKREASQSDVGKVSDLHNNEKRKFGMGSSGFHGDTFNEGWGGFDTMKKRRPEWDSTGFYGDTFSGGFGDFGTMKKRRPEMTSSGFHGDIFSGGFGDFGTMKKRRPEMTSSGFHGDIFSGGFGDFGTMKKRRPEMTSSGFHGDIFSGGFGDFGTMKKRRPEMTSSGFYGDTFNNGFGDFYTMKRAMLKRRPEMTSSGFFGDTFSGGFGDFSPMKRSVKGLSDVEQTDTANAKSDSTDPNTSRIKRNSQSEKPLQKRRSEMTSNGFHGDTFSSGFGDFSTMKRDYSKRQPEMTSSGFYGDTFSNGFGGNFYTMKKNSHTLYPRQVAHDHDIPFPSSSDDGEAPSKFESNPAKQR